MSHISLKLLAIWRVYVYLHRFVLKLIKFIVDNVQVISKDIHLMHVKVLELFLASLILSSRIYSTYICHWFADNEKSSKLDFMHYRKLEVIASSLTNMDLFFLVLYSFSTLTYMRMFEQLLTQRQRKMRYGTYPAVQLVALFYTKESWTMLILLRDCDVTFFYQNLQGLVACRSNTGYMQ